MFVTTIIAGRVFYLCAGHPPRVLSWSSERARALQFSGDDAVFLAETFELGGVHLVGHHIHVVGVGCVNKRDGEKVGVFLVNETVFDQPDGAVAALESLALGGWGGGHEKLSVMWGRAAKFVFLPVAKHLAMASVSEGTTSAQRINRLPLQPRCSYGGICPKVGGERCAEICRAQWGKA